MHSALLSSPQLCSVVRWHPIAVPLATSSTGLSLVKQRIDARRENSDVDVPWSLPALRREWNRVKDQEADWWRENSKEAYSSGLDALARSLQNFSAAKRGKRRGHSGFPGFRKRGAKDSCRFTTGSIRVDDSRHVTLPRLGRLRTSEETDALVSRLRAGKARIIGATISREADRWFVAFTCEVKREMPVSSGHEDCVGVDLGVLRLATLSNGEMVAGVRALKSAGRRLARSARTFSRREKGSGRGRQAQVRLARAHRRVHNIRHDQLHKLTTTLAKNHGRLVIEDLNVRGMMRAARGAAVKPGRNVRAKAGLNRSLADAAFGELRRLLEYKCRWYGSHLVLAPRWFASSRRYSACGEVREKRELADRTYACPVCGLEIDRDLNAARNLAWWAVAGPQELTRVAASAAETINARGEDIRPGRGLADLDEARTETVSEPAGLTGGLKQGFPCVPC